MRHDDGYYRAAAKWLRALDDGMKTHSYWAKVFDIDWRIVRDWRNGVGLDRYGVSDEVLDRASGLINSGMSFKAAAREIGSVSHMTLLKHIHKPATMRTTDVWARAVEFLEDGCSYIEVSRSTGIPDKELRTRFPGYGWTVLESAKFSADVRSIRKRMPKNIQEIFFGSVIND